MWQILLGLRSPEPVALGWKYRGRCVRQGTIVYCALEGAEGFRNRIEAFRQAKLPEADGDPPFHLMATPLSLVREHKVFIADISNQLAGQRPVAVCIDTLNRSLDGSESSDEDMTAYVRAADAIRDAFGCLVVIVHHCGHNRQTKGAGTDMLSLTPPRHTPTFMGPLRVKRAR
jgi:RecA-family ATPase